MEDRIDVASIIKVVLVLIIMAGSSFVDKKVGACSCSVPSVCLAYSRADAVFTGRILEIRDEPASIGTVFQNKIARFSVEQVFKGAVSNDEVITLMKDYCIDRPLVVGERYFVYREKSNFVRLCNRTAIFNEKSPDFLYARSLSARNPIFTIRGYIPGLEDSDRRAARVVITKGKKEFLPKIDDGGKFEVTVGKEGLYKIALYLPFQAIVEVTSGQIGYDANTTHSENRTTVNYQVEFKPNSCDEIEVRFAKVKE